MQIDTKEKLYLCIVKNRTVMRRKCYFIILLLAFVPLALQCSSPQLSVKSPVEALSFDKEQVWQLVSIQGVANRQRTAAEEVILMFHPESGTLRGRVACNRYFADYRLRGVKVTDEGSRYMLSVDNVSGGDVQCPEGDMALQERYLSQLAKADACLLTPYVLTLYRKDKEILRFELQ